MKKKYLAVPDGADQATKDGIEAINNGIEQAYADAETQIKTASEKQADELKKQSELFEQKMKDAAEQGQKNLEEKEAELKQMLTELNRVKAEEKSARIKTMGDAIYEALTENEEQLKNWTANKSEKSFTTKAVGTIGVPANGVAPDFQPIVPLPHEIVHARNVIPVFPTTSDLIRYIQMTTKEGAIAPVGAGVAKPQFDYTPVVKDAPVRKIAGYVTVTDEFLDDVVGSRAWLANELPQAYLDVEDQQIFKGNGTGNNLFGLMYNSQNLVLPKGTVTTASNKWDQLAAAGAQIRRNKRVATAAWVSPEDYMELFINKTTIGEYTYPMMAQGRPLMLGDLPIYQHSVFLPNEALVGDFARGVAIFQKLAPIVKYSTEHANNFTENLTTVLVEARIALPVYFPDGFVHIDFNGVAS